MDKYYDETNPLPEISQFRVLIQEELEKRLTKMPSMGLEHEEGDD